MGTKFYRVARFLFALFTSSALAQTPVSGGISTDTHWTTAAAPYILSGEVVVQNGAMLTIDPGVAVYMAPGAKLTVLAGGVKASGTAASPVLVRSDNSRLNQPAAPGDWDQWVFTSGTVNTRLDHVLFEHGRGIAVQGSAPVFNYLDLRNHDGAAISIDLAASPSGVGNRASGNTINGIAVPPGDISGNVNWGLRGIPYVVTGGRVSVGHSPAVQSIEPASLQQGETVTAVVTGTRLTGLTQPVLDQPGISAQVLPGATSTQASLSLTAEVSAPIGTAGLRLLTDAGEIHLPSAITIIQLQPVITGLNPSSVYAGQEAVDVVIAGRNFTDQSVALVDGNPVTTEFLSATQLRVNIATQPAPGTVGIRLRTPDPLHEGQFLTSNEFALIVAAAQLTLTPDTVSMPKGASRTLTLSLPFVAPTGGLSFDLVSSVPTVAGVPASVTLPQGAANATFQVDGLDLGTTAVTASRAGSLSGQAQVIVVPPPALTLTPNQLTLGVGRTAEVTLQSNTTAGPEGLAVALSSTDPAVATVPATITIPPGGLSTTFDVTTVALGTASLQAQAPEFIPATASVTVRPLSLVLPVGALVAPGLSRSIPLNLSDPAPAGGLVINLTSSDPAAASVPASVTVPAGQSSVNFNLTGVAAGTATITASASGYESAAMSATVETVTISIGSPAKSAVSVPVDIVQPYPVYLSRPAPAGGVVVSLTTDNPSVASVSPASITIAEGQTSGGLVTLSLTGLTTGATTLVASAAGLNPANVGVTVTGKAQLKFSVNTVTVGSGLKTYQYEVFVSRQTDGQNYAPDQPVTVNFTSSDPDRASAAPVVIPANSASAYFYVVGGNLTGGTPVTIDATAPGYSAPAQKLAVTVIAPVFTFDSLDVDRTPLSVRDNFRLRATVPGSTYSTNQTAAADLPVDLAIVDASPADVVDGFYSAAMGGTPTTQVLLRSNNTYGEYAYVGTPAKAGSYKVQASSGGGSSVSGTVTVNAPELRFSKSTVTVGKGLKTYPSEVYIQRTVNGQLFNGAEALTVFLGSSDPSKASIPASVTIGANASQVSVPVTGVDLTDGTSVIIDASAAGYGAPVTKLAATVIAPMFTFSSLDLNRSPVSARDAFRVYTEVPGAAYSSAQEAAADLLIDLALVEADPPDVVDGYYTTLTGGTPVTQVVMRSNYRYADAYVGVPAKAGSYKVQASAAGGVSTSSAVTVSAPDLMFSRTTVTVGKGFKTYINEVYITRAVNGQSFNGSEALTVYLSSSDPAKASVPASVTIPANASQVAFYVTGIEFTGGVPITIDAVAAGYSAPATKLGANVVAPVFAFNLLDTNRSPMSARDNVQIYVSVPGSAYPSNQTAAADLLIDWAVVEANPADVVDGFYGASTGGASVTQTTLHSGSSSSDWVYVGTPAKTGTYKIQASAVGIASVTSGVVSVAMPELKFTVTGRTSVFVGKGLKTYTTTNSGEVKLSRTVNGQEFNGAEALTVNLACSSAAICNAPATVIIPANGSSVYFQVDGVDIGATTITASAAGYSSPQDLSVNVVAPQIGFSGLAAPKVGSADTFQVYVTAPGAYYASSQTAVNAIAIDLTSSAPGVATVTPTATIPAGSVYSNNVTLTGVTAGTTTVTASGPGLSSVTSGVLTISP